ncbi:hypothetical protein DFH11DRAFT_1595517 [Phellopilus nigrolimitatus]|nr:hypothetical protein DFH11DRAFT_1595517 [Phellopilus nigrolimitatus]
MARLLYCIRPCVLFFCARVKVCFPRVPPSGLCPIHRRLKTCKLKNGPCAGAESHRNILWAQNVRSAEMWRADVFAWHKQFSL